MGRDQTALSRRTLLRLLGAAGLTPAAASLLAACSSPTTSTGATDPGAATTPSAKKVGGDIRVDVLADPLTMDPIFRNAVEGQRVYRLVTSQLLRYKQDKSFEPDLASELPTVSADRLTYTVKLKTGVKWHDGKPFDSSDVKYSYDLIRDPAQASVWNAALAFVDSVEAPDPTTIIIKMKSPFTPMLHKMALMPIISSKIPYERDKTYARTLVGTGPFKFVEWTQGQQVVVERNTEYFESGKPFLQKITFRTVQENAARVTNIVNNTTQIVPEAPNNQLALLRQRGVNVEVLNDSTARLFCYPSMQEGRPTADVNFRLALAWAIDRQAIVDQVLNGAGVPASTYLSSGSLYFDRTLGNFFGGKPDLTKARDYLQKANFNTSREIDFVCQNLPDLVDIATIVQANLKAIGINMKISAEEVAAFVPKLNNGQYDLLLTRSPAGSTAGYSPDYVYLGFSIGSPSNFNRFTDQRMDELIKKAVAAPDDQAAAAWKDVQQRDVETVGQLQLVTARYVEAYSKNLVDHKPSPLTMLYGLPNTALA